MRGCKSAVSFHLSNNARLLGATMRPRLRQPYTSHFSTDVSARLRLAHRSRTVTCVSSPSGCRCCAQRHPAPLGLPWIVCEECESWDESC